MPSLRPQFTDSIAKLLQTHSVNVIIPTMGAEAERFVQDIQQGHNFMVI